MVSLLKKLIGSRNDRLLKQYRKLVTQINGLEPKIAALSDAELAAKLAALGVPSFACTPDAFPQLMAAAIRRDDVAAWAATQGFKTSQ